MRMGYAFVAGERTTRSAGLANANMCRDGMYRGGEEPELQAARYRPPAFSAWKRLWTLGRASCSTAGWGPSSAGSASGGNAQPRSATTAFMSTLKSFHARSGGRGLRQGRSFVSNGPLLRCRAAGNFNLHRSDGGRVDVAVQLSSRDPVGR
jgi:hypothetical protein